LKDKELELGVFKTEELNLFFIFIFSLTWVSGPACAHLD
jgi:hypothetical protein